MQNEQASEWLLLDDATLTFHIFKLLNILQGLRRHLNLGEGGAGGSVVNRNFLTDFAVAYVGISAQMLSCSEVALKDFVEYSNFPTEDQKKVSTC